MAVSAKQLAYVPSEVLTVNAAGVYYRELNRALRKAVLEGTTEVNVENVFGQRYIGTSLRQRAKLRIFGTPGNDLGAFMDGPEIEVFGNAQDGVGNTMNSGEIVVHGNAGDVLAMSMRGGAIYVKGDAGYRCAIHMKEYGERSPLVVIGGTAQDFFGEYMAGGTVILFGLGLKSGEFHRSNFIGTGMHAGRIYVRGGVSEGQLGKEVGVAELDEIDRATVERAARRYCTLFKAGEGEILSGKFVKLYPRALRPYGRLYAY